MGKPTHLLEPWQKEDAARLLALFEKYRANGGQKQEDFAANYGIGSQGNMGHYLHGRRPLNIETAGKFAKGLGISVEAFSPTLAGKIAAAHQTTNAAKRDGWPFPDIERARFDALSLRQQIEIQGVVRERIERFEGDAEKSHKGNGTNGRGPSSTWSSRS